MTLEEYVRSFDLEPLEGEGGFFRRVHTFEDGSVIYYAMDETNFSYPHRLDADEVWFHLDGSAVTIVVVDLEGTEVEHVLDKSNPILVVPALWWQSARPTHGAALCATTMNPAWTKEGFTLADESFIARYPQTRKLIR